MLNGLDLFSGIGGLSVALREWVRPIAYCEIDAYCQGILLSRMHKQELQEAPIWDDIVSFNGYAFRDKVDIIFGGFPCQDISVAGNGKGLEGERSGLFFEIKRLVHEIRPSYIFLENVPAITSRGGVRVVNEITEMGYDCRWLVISAASVGALHRRERWFLLAHSSGQRLEGFGEGTCGTSEEQPLFACNSPVNGSIDEWKEAVSTICRTSDGVPFRVDRLRALGNSVVARQAKEAFKILMGLT